MKLRQGGTYLLPVRVEQITANDGGTQTVEFSTNEQPGIEPQRFTLRSQFNQPQGQPRFVHHR